jgi:hypothetical protein
VMRVPARSDCAQRTAATTRAVREASLQSLRQRLDNAKPCIA